MVDVQLSRRLGHALGLGNEVGGAIFDAGMESRIRGWYRKNAKTATFSSMPAAMQRYILAVEQAATTDLSDAYEETPDSRDLTGGGTMGTVDLSELARRVSQIEDPELRAIAQERVVDLVAGYGDHKPPYDWKHGYIPISPAAKAIAAGRAANPNSKRKSKKPPLKSVVSDSGGGSGVKLTDKRRREIEADLERQRKKDTPYAEAQVKEYEEALRTGFEPPPLKRRMEFAEFPGLRDSMEKELGARFIKSGRKDGEMKTEFELPDGRKLNVHRDVGGRRERVDIEVDGKMVGHANWSLLNQDPHDRTKSVMKALREATGGGSGGRKPRLGEVGDGPPASKTDAGELAEIDRMIAESRRDSNMRKALENRRRNIVEGRRESGPSQNTFGPKAPADQQLNTRGVRVAKEVPSSVVSEVNRQAQYPNAKARVLNVIDQELRATKTGSAKHRALTAYRRRIEKLSG